MRRHFKVRHIFASLLLLCTLWLVYLGYAIIAFGKLGMPTQNADVAVVLGAAVEGDSPSPVFQERINHAIQLYQNGLVRMLIFTGGYAQGVKHAESDVARHYAIRNGVKQNDILIETKSATTQQNILRAQELMKANDLHTALIVSDPLHMKRAMRMANDLGFIAFPSPTPSTKYRSLSTQIPFLLREMYFYHYYWIFSE